MLGILKIYKKETIGLLKGLVFLALCIPLIINVYHLFPFVFPKAIFFQSVIELSVVLFLGLILVDRQFLPPRNALFATVSLWVFLMFLSAVFGFNFLNSFWSKAERMDGVFWYLHTLAFFFIILALFWSLKDWIYLLQWNSLVGFVAGVLSLLAKFFPHILLVGDQTRLGGTFGNPAFLATYFAVSLFFNLFLFFWLSGNKQKWVWFFLAVFSLVMVLLSGTRGAYLGVGAGLLVFGAFILFSGRTKYYKISAAFFIGLLALGLSFVFLRSFWESYLPFISSRIYSIWQIPPQRLLVWQVGLRAFQERPIFGWGQENFLYAFNQQFDPNIYQYEVAIFDRPHNKLVDILVTNGIVGFVAYAGIFFVLANGLIKRLLGARKSAKETPKPQIDFYIIGLSLLAGLWAAYFIQNLVLFEMPSSSVILFLMFAFSDWFLFSLPKQIGLDKVLPQKPRQVFVSDLFISFGKQIVFVGAVLVMAAVFYFGVVMPVRASQSLIRSIQLLNLFGKPEQLSEARKEYQKARSFDTFLNKEIDINMARKLREFVYSQKITEPESFKKFSYLVRENLLRDLGRYPQDYDLLIEAANLSLMHEIKLEDHSQPGVLELAEQAQKFAPQRFEAYEISFIYHLYTDSPQGASADLKKLFNLGREIGINWFYQAVYEARWGTEAKVIENIKLAKQFGFFLEDRITEQQLLLNAFLFGKNTEQGIQTLAFLLEDSSLSELERLRYVLYQIELYARGGVPEKAQALLAKLLAPLPPKDRENILQYLGRRGLVINSFD